MTDERFLDWDEGEIRNEPQDDPDDWEWSCLSEEAHRRMLERVREEMRKEKEHGR